jgi:glycosidase
MISILIAFSACSPLPADPVSVGVVEGLPKGTAGFPWWNDTVFYEIFVRSFYDSDCDGIGDIPGLIAKLDYLNDGDPNTSDDLGVTGLWLMPINPSPSYHGYDVTNYYEINPEFGTLDDFKLLIKEAHARNIYVVMDLVINHTSSQHPWFVDSQSPDSQYRDWYRWSNELPGINWHSGENGYYYALFWSEMPDLNYSNPDVIEEMYEVSQFWLEEIGVDGFRIDAVKHLIETDSQTKNTTETFQWFGEFGLHIDHISPNALTVGEVWDSSVWAAEYVRQGALDLTFSFDLSAGYLSAASSGRAIQANYPIEADLRLFPDSQLAVFLSNHDQNRSMSMFKKSQGKASVAASMLLTTPGVPFIYYGEEIGMMGKKPDELIRAPMQWTSDSNAGFSCGEPWESPNTHLTKANVADQLGDQDSLLSWYQELIKIRSQHAALRIGETFLPDVSSSHVFSTVRYTEDEALIILINLSDQTQTNVEISLESSAIPKGKYTALPIMGPAVEEKLVVDESGGIESFQPVFELPPHSTYIFQIYLKK